eukprot:259983-Pelagomonas_calceolata.AAC.3
MPGPAKCLRGLDRYAPNTGVCNCDSFCTLSFGVPPAQMSLSLFVRAGIKQPSRFQPQGNAVSQESQMNASRYKQIRNDYNHLLRKYVTRTHIFP